MTTLDKQAFEQRWSQMLRDLEAEPRVTVNVAEKAAPADEAEVLRILEELEIPADPELVAFSTWANGIQLNWTIEGGERHGGSISITSVDQLNDEESPAMEMLEDFPLESYGVEFDPAAGHVFPFDFFQRDQDNLEAACLLPRDGSVDVFASEDEMACFTDTLLVSFAEYLDLLFRSYGAPGARAALQQGYSNDEASYARDKIPGILTKRVSLSDLVDYTLSDPDVGQTNEFFR